MNEVKNSNGKLMFKINYLEEVWIPGMAEAGLKFFAHIHSDNVFTQLSASRIVSESKHGIEFRHFKDESIAKKWLLER